jgi:hypothetical protein
MSDTTKTPTAEEKFPCDHGLSSLVCVCGTCATQRDGALARAEASLRAAEEEREAWRAAAFKGTGQIAPHAFLDALKASSAERDAAVGARHAAEEQAASWREGCQRWNDEARALGALLLAALPDTMGGTPDLFHPRGKDWRGWEEWEDRAKKALTRASIIGPGAASASSDTKAGEAK